MRLLRPLLLADGAIARQLGYARWRILVIQQRIDAAEPFFAKKLFRVESTIGLAKLCMPLVWHLTQALI